LASFVVIASQSGWGPRAWSASRMKHRSVECVCRAVITVQEPAAVLGHAPHFVALEVSKVERAGREIAHAAPAGAERVDESGPLQRLAHKVGNARPAVGGRYVAVAHHECVFD
jgi:hypothetical protein